MIIDPKNLVRVPAGEFKKGGVFYLLESDGSYSVCQHFPEEFNNPERGPWLAHLTEKYRAAGRLFVSRNRPWARV